MERTGHEPRSFAMARYGPPFITTLDGTTISGRPVDVAAMEFALIRVHALKVGFALIASLATANASAQSAKGFLPKEVYPAVPSKVLERCAKAVSSECLSDIAWVLVRQGEDDWLAAPHFAAVGEQERAEVLVNRIPATEDTRRQHAAAYVAGQLLAQELSRGQTSALSTISDQQVIAIAAGRLLGYLDDARFRGRRIKVGFGQGNARLAVRADVAHMLVMRWDELVRQGARYGRLPTSYGRIGLAEMWLLLGEPERARATIKASYPSTGDCDRKLVAIYLRLGEPDQALASAANDSRARGLCKNDVAQWLHASG